MQKTPKFVPAYKQAILIGAEQYKASADLKGKGEYCPVHLDQIAYDILDTEGKFKPVVQALRYRNTWAKKLWYDFLADFTDQEEEKLKRWYKQEWKQQNLDYNLPAPPPLEITQIDGGTWIVGTLKVWVEGRGRMRDVKVTNLNASIPIHAFKVDFKQELPNQKFKNMTEKTFLLALPQLRKIALLMDWTRLGHISKEQHRALTRRFMLITSYYQDRKKYEWRLHDLKPSDKSLPHFSWHDAKKVLPTAQANWLEYVKAEKNLLG